MSSTAGRKRLLLTAAKSDTNAVFMVKGNPRDESEFVTVGKFHALFWHFDGVTLRNKRAIFAGSASTSSASSSASKSRGGADANSPVSFYSIAFSERGYACLGSSDGSILVFVNGKCAKTFAGVHRGKLLTLEWYRGGFVSGGSDGRVHVLDKKMVSHVPASADEGRAVLGWDGLGWRRDGSGARAAPRWDGLRHKVQSSEG